MLDNPKKTMDLILTLKAATPFEIELPPSLVDYLRTQGVEVDSALRRVVSDIHYLDDEGGILCRLEPKDGKGALVVSITHLRAPGALPFADAVLDYQKHRMKKLKKLHGANWKSPQIAKS